MLNGILAFRVLVFFSMINVFPCWSAPSAGIVKRPNIVFILADDLGYAELGCYGQEKIETLDSAKPFSSERGRGKAYVYEGGIRVPLIAHWAGKIQPGSRSDHLSAFWDVLPTLCEVAGAEIPRNTDGISFLPTLLGKRKQRPHGYLYWEFSSSGGLQAVRKDPWKAIRNKLDKNDLTIQLYNLDQDLREQQDVAAQYPEVVKEMEYIMRTARTTPSLERFRIKALGD